MMLTEIRTEATGSGTPDGAHLRYRPHLDGLRAVAVYLVVAYHAGLGVFSGGFIGVDIFFVLSGFLVTKILVRDLASVGRVRGPAVLRAASSTDPPGRVRDARRDRARLLRRRNAGGGTRRARRIPGAFLYVANWYFIRQSTDYFAANVDVQPGVDFWSLAVEEQFYLVWPMLLGGLYLVTARAGRWRWWTVRTSRRSRRDSCRRSPHSVSARRELSRAYYGTDTRAYQLLAGAALALTPQLIHVGARWRRLAPWVSALSLAGLMALATSRFDMSPISRGVLVAALTVILLAALENARGGFAKNMLSTGPFTYLGRISYGAYLWHWPVIVIVAYDRSLSPISLFAIACLLATALAALSFHLIERPIRASRTLDRYKTPIIATGLAASVVCGAVVMPAILDSESSTVIALPGAGTASGLQLLDWRVAKNDRPDLPDCLGQCGAAVHSRDRHRIASSAHGRQPRMDVDPRPSPRSRSSARGHCRLRRIRPARGRSTCKCSTRREPRARNARPIGTTASSRTLDPDLIVLVHQALRRRRPAAFRSSPRTAAWSYPGTPQHEPLLMNASSASLRELQRPGRELLILEPVPDAPPGTDHSPASRAGVLPRAARTRRPDSPRRSSSSTEPKRVNPASRHSISIARSAHAGRRATPWSATSSREAMRPT